LSPAIILVCLFPSLLMMPELAHKMQVIGRWSAAPFCAKLAKLT
jgi:hypothetical protein